MGQLLRTSFARELETLQTDTLMLGSMVTQALKESVEALRTRDLETARRLDKEDEIINKKRFQIGRLSATDCYSSLWQETCA